MRRPAPDWAPPPRRRLYLMRHGSVEYFAAGRAPADASTVALSEAGRAQADAAGEFFAAAGVRFDRVVTSGLPRTRQTAERVLARLDAGARTPVEAWPELRELESGQAEPPLAPTAEPMPSARGVDPALADPAAAELARLHAAFVAPFEGEPARDARFRDGESVGELLDRVVPAIERFAADPDWQVALMVLHGGVNRVVLSYALTGARTLLAGFQQAPACINAIDVAARREQWLVRYVNHAPYDPAQAAVRDSTIETLFSQYLAHQGS